MDKKHIVLTSLVIPLAIVMALCVWSIPPVLDEWGLLLLIFGFSFGYTLAGRLIYSLVVRMGDGRG